MPRCWRPMLARNTGRSGARACGATSARGAAHRASAARARRKQGRIYHLTRAGSAGSRNLVMRRWAARSCSARYDWLYDWRPPALKSPTAMLPRSAETTPKGSNMFPTTIAGSLPKPSWLAEPDKLWPPWRLARRRSRSRQARRHAARAQAAGRRRHRHRQRRRAVAPAFRARLSRIRRRHRLRAQGRDGHPQRPLQGDGADRHRRAASSRAACTRREARHARAHTKRKLKFTLPGPMTIVDTIADQHYGDRDQDGVGLRRSAQRRKRARSKPTAST